MKINFKTLGFQFILISLPIALLFSCEKKTVCIQPESSELSSVSPLTSQSGMPFSESSDKWTALKNLNGNSYVYQTTFDSWIGESSITEVKVIDGIVTSRVYEHFRTSETTGQHELIESYSETIADLGTHENGALPITIDELYTTCSSDYLTVDVNNNTIHFETELNGLMTLCGFVPNDCLDDCYSGVSISNFDWL